MKAERPPIWPRCWSGNAIELGILSPFFDAFLSSNYQSRSINSLPPGWIRSGGGFGIPEAALGGLAYIYREDGA